MSKCSVLSLPRDAWSVARRDGLSTAVKAGLRRINASYEGYYYYANYRYKRFRGQPCVDERTFFRTLAVDPDLITFLPARRFDKWKNAGEIRDGDWDRPAREFDDLPVVDALRSRFVDDREWEELAYVSRALDTVQSGESTWNGCQTVEDVYDRCRTIDRLYESIREDGFKSQAELHDADP